jgi:hypothetical protein
MHCAGSYLAKLLGRDRDNRRAAAQRTLAASEAVALSEALHWDARDYYYSAWVTAADALRGLGQEFYTWATVKLYYTVFYSLRSTLALGDDCIFHVRTSPFHIHATAGASATPLRENTHKSVLRTFERQRPSHFLLSQRIETSPPLDWLMARREDANYRAPRFPEPTPPNHFANLEEYGLRRLLSTYLGDVGHKYTFDPDHAMLAFPIRTLESLSREFAAAHGASLAGEETAFLRRICKDRAGALTDLVELLGDAK